MIVRAEKALPIQSTGGSEPRNGRRAFLPNFVLLYGCSGLSVPGRRRVQIQVAKLRERSACRHIPRKPRKAPGNLRSTIKFQDSIYPRFNSPGRHCAPELAQGVESCRC